jgi:hypothetical protein
VIIREEVIYWDGFGGGQLHFHPGKVGCVPSRVTRDGGCLLTGQRAMVMVGAAAPTRQIGGMA